MKKIDRILEWINIGLMGTLTVFVLASVFLRYFLNISFIWAEELIIFIFISTTYFGIILCVKENEHIRIDFLLKQLPKSGKKVLESLISLIGVVTLLWMAKSSIGWIQQVGDTLTPGLKIMSKYIYILMPFSFFVSAVYEIRKIGQVWLLEREGQ